MKAAKIVKGLMLILAITMASVSWGKTAPVTFHGEATAADVTVLGVNTVLGSTGALPTTGGTLESDLATVNIPLLLTGAIAHSDAIGIGDHAEASSTVAGFNLLSGGLTITADLIQSQVYVSGTNDQPPVGTGSSLLANLVVAGQPIVITGKPNQKIKLPVGSITINEQTQGVGKITVIALHIVITGVADVQLASSTAGIGPCSGCTHTCSGTPNCGNQDFVIGAGTVLNSLNGVADFGLNLNNTSSWGGFIFNDPEFLISYEATSITGYTIISPTERLIDGVGKLDGLLNVNYTLDIVLNGSQTGVFTLTLANGYKVSGQINLGFLEIQQSCNN
jgi:hypothetical protein